MDEEVKDRILAQRRAKEIQKEPEPLPPEERRKEFPAGISDEEFLLRATMPEQQVDAMLASGSPARHYNPDLVPVMELLRELRSRPKVAQLLVEKDAFRLRVAQGASTD
jgi:oxaloacetate decarboxylase alpha subunit